MLLGFTSDVCPRPPRPRLSGDGLRAACLISRWRPQSNEHWGKHASTFPWNAQCLWLQLPNRSQDLRTITMTPYLYAYSETRAEVKSTSLDLNVYVHEHPILVPVCTVR